MQTVDKIGLKMKSRGTSFVLIALWLTMALLMTELGTVSAAPTAARCKQLRRLGINACKPVIFGAHPSSDCCYRVRVTPLECVCSVVTPEVAVMVMNFPRFYEVIRNCGRQIPRHYRCGSITTP
ncbi:hypothetical protein QQ045_019349 [Rhodiola kirilowii]